MIDMRKKFEEMKRNEGARLEKRTKSVNDDPRLIKWTQGQTYRMRLLFTTTDERNSPFIHKNVHSYYNEETKESAWVTCPTSEYLEDLRGFNSCPTCKKNNDFYKEGQAGSPSAAEMYKQFKRKFYGFAPVYVVSDTSNPENNGKIMIMKYGFKIYEFLKLNVFGVDVKSKQVVDGDELIGADAFDLKSGYDLIVSVTANNSSAGKFNAYNMSFSKKQTPVPVSDADVEKAVKELKFDEDFCTKSSKSELEKFFNTYVFHTEMKEEIGAAKADKSVLEEEVSDADAEAKEAGLVAEPEGEVAEPAPAPKASKIVERQPKAEPVKAEMKAAMKPVKAAAPVKKEEEDEIDIDALLKTVDEKYGDK